MNSTFKVMKEDLNLIREVLDGLDEDIGYIADIASKYKSKELTEEKSIDSIRGLNSSDLFFAYTGVIKNLKVIKGELKPIERRLNLEVTNLKTEYSFFDWLFLRPLWVKVGIMEI